MPVQYPSRVADPIPGSPKSQGGKRTTVPACELQTKGDWGSRGFLCGVQALDLVGGESDAGVRNGELHASGVVRFSCATDGNADCRVCELDRVANQIGQDLTQKHGVGVDGLGKWKRVVHL